MASSNDVPFVSYPDITDRILLHLPDLQSLRCAILTSKAIFGVFQAHPQSTIRAVALNEIGPAFKQALDLAKIVYTDNGSSLNLSAHDEHTMIDAHEALSLSENARVARDLESLYSLREKDQTSKTSRLSHFESLRFQRALYHLWIYTRLSRSHLTSYDELDEDDDDEDEPEDSQNNQEHKFGTTSREAFLLQLDEKNLNEITEIHAFFQDLVRWTLVSRRALPYSTGIVDSWLNSLYVEGPPEILNHFSTSMARQLMTPVQSTHFNRSFQLEADIATVRQLKGFASPDDMLSAIRERTASHECDLCNTPKGAKLYNSTNWEWIKGLIEEEINHFLPGELPRNPWESNALCAAVKPMGYVAMLHSMFSSKKETYADINESNWLCLDCVKAFIRAHLMEWWLEHKQTSGGSAANSGPIPSENCWYGYECRTQTHRHPHAARLNHLCPPTPRESS